jgi:hypothetical protein
VAMGLYLFALVMITLNLAAFRPEFGFNGMRTKATRQIAAPPGPI